MAGLCHKWWVFENNEKKSAFLRHLPIARVISTWRTGGVKHSYLERESLIESYSIVKTIQLNQALCVLEIFVIFYNH